MEIKNLYDAAASQPGAISIANDWRKLYSPVASTWNFNPAYNETLQRKLTDVEIIKSLKKRIAIIKKWKAPATGKSIEIKSTEIFSKLYHFCEQGGVMAIPFEIWFYNSEKKIEKKIQKNYPDLVSWNLKLDQIEDLKRYYKMKEELLSGITQKDLKDVLFSFYENKYFFPQKKFVPWIWYDIRGIGIKPYPIGDNETEPVIQLKGYIYAWGDFWIEDWLKNCSMESQGGIGFKTFYIYSPTTPSTFFINSNASLFKDWISNRIVELIKDEESILSRMFKMVLKTSSFKDYEVQCETNVFKNIKITFYRKNGNLLETLYDNKGKFLLGVIIREILRNKKK